MNAISFIINHWNELCAVGLVIVILVHCARNGVNCNIGEFPKRR